MKVVNKIMNSTRCFLCLVPEMFNREAILKQHDNSILFNEWNSLRLVLQTLIFIFIGPLHELNTILYLRPSTCTSQFSTVKTKTLTCSTSHFILRILEIDNDIK